MSGCMNGFVFQCKYGFILNLNLDELMSESMAEWMDLDLNEKPTLTLNDWTHELMDAWVKNAWVLNGYTKLALYELENERTNGWLDVKLEE